MSLTMNTLHDPNMFKFYYVMVELKNLVNLQKGLEHLDQLFNFFHHPNVGLLQIGHFLLQIVDLLCLFINDSSQSCFLIIKKTPTCLRPVSGQGSKVKK